MEKVKNNKPKLSNLFSPLLFKIFFPINIPIN